MPSTYFQDIADGIRTTLKGLGLTAGHLWAARKRRMPGDIRRDTFFEQSEGMVTIQYPLETIPIPDNGRYRLHNEMDDCIVCDKCAKVCPVDCIEIEPIRAIEEVGKASDGSPIRLYAAKFDIDMAKCCYCGLCTTVCPTECLTMTKSFDYSEFDVRDMVYEYGNLTPAEADEKKRLLEQFQKEKEALKAAAQTAPKTIPTDKPAAPRPAFRPTKAPVATTSDSVPPVESVSEKEEVIVKKAGPPFRPSMKPKTEQVTENPNTADEVPSVSKPAFKPTMKPKAEVPAETENEAAKVPPADKPKPAFRPTMRPPAAAKPAAPEAKAEQPAETENAAAVPPADKPKPAFRPTMRPPAAAKPAAPGSQADQPAETENDAVKVPPVDKPKPAFRPTMKPPAAAKPVAPEAQADLPAETENDAAKVPPADKPKPAFRPTMKPGTGPAKPTEE